MSQFSKSLKLSIEYKSRRAKSNAIFESSWYADKGDNERKNRNSLDFY